MPEAEENKINKTEKKKKSILRYILSITLVLTATGLSLYLSLRNNYNIILNILKTSDYKYVAIVVGLVIFMTFLRGLIYFCFARLYTRRYNIFEGLAIDQIGLFFNSVTMGATGGQIMQARIYSKQGVPISSAVSILAMYSIVFQIVLILFGAASFIFKYDFISTVGTLGPFRFMDIEFNLPIWPLTIIGFIVNLFVILLVLLMGYWHKFHNFIMGPVVSFLAKIKILKTPDKTRENLRIQVENFKIEFSRLLTNIPFFILMIILFSIYFLARFSIPYFCGLALDPFIEQSWSNFWDSVFLSNYHQMITGLIPLPGSVGISELFYTQLFGSYFSDIDYCKASLILWRSMTFIIPTFFAGLITAFYRTKDRSLAVPRDEFPERETFVSLQNETFAARQVDLQTLIETTKLTHEAVMAKIKQSYTKHFHTDTIKLNDTYDDIDINSEDKKKRNKK